MKYRLFNRTESLLIVLWGLGLSLGVAKLLDSGVKDQKVQGSIQYCVDVDETQVSFNAISVLGYDAKLNSDAGHGLYIVDVPASKAKEFKAKLAKLPQIESVQENSRFVVFGVPNDPMYKDQWNFKMVDVESAWNQDITGEDVVVAVIDTGVAFEKKGRYPQASDLVGTHYRDAKDFSNDTEIAYDDHGHGTHVAGTIAQKTNNNHGVAGLAYDATIIPIKVLSASGSGTLADVADGIYYAADKGADVINMSLGSSRGDKALEAACQYALEKGVLIVCAAGNSGREGVGYPAAYPSCLAVSAVSPNGEMTFYSSWGREVFIAAPGGDTRNFGKLGGVLQNTVADGVDSFEAWNGTSMASPHVAGAAALIIQAYNVKHGTKPSAAKVREILANGAVPKGDPKKFGAGILNIAKSIEKCGA